MIIKKYKSVVKSIDNPLEGIYVVTFSAVDKGFKFKPGHFLHIALDEYDPSMQWPESRCFSMRSSPDNKAELTITYAVKGEFTKRMASTLKVGSEVWLKLPYGEIFTEDHNKKNVVFIAGGTGVTPFLSLLTDPSFAEYINPVMYLGVRSQSHYIYQHDFDVAKTVNSGLDVHIINQEKQGILDIGRIYDENPNACTYFISGPPVMIRCFKQFLVSKGVCESVIRSDDWE